MKILQRRTPIASDALFNTGLHLKTTTKAMRHYLPSAQSLERFQALPPELRQVYKNWVKYEQVRLNASVFAPIVTLISAAIALVGVSFAMRTGSLVSKDAQYESNRSSSIEIDAALRALVASGRELSPASKAVLERGPLAEFSFVSNEAQIVFMVALMVLLAASAVWLLGLQKAHRVAQMTVWADAFDACGSNQKGLPRPNTHRHRSGSSGIGFGRPRGNRRRR